MNEAAYIIANAVRAGCNAIASAIREIKITTPTDGPSYIPPADCKRCPECGELLYFDCPIKPVWKCVKCEYREEYE